MKREWLIALRKARQMTQEYVSSESFIDRAYYAQIENGSRDPSFTVVIKLSQTLGFDPYMFFKEIMDRQPSRTEVSELQITDYFKIMNGGRVLYIYDDFEKYLDNAVTFISGGLKRGICSLIIDTQENCIQIQNRLKTLPERVPVNQILFITRNNSFSPQLVSRLRSQPFFRFWANPGSYELQLLTELTGIKYDKILSVAAYNGSLLSAAQQIKLMRLYEYIMTDTEMGFSPLCKTSDKSIIFPSLSEQSDL